MKETEREKKGGGLLLYNTSGRCHGESRRAGTNGTRQGMLSGITLELDNER